MRTRAIFVLSALTLVAPSCGEGPASAPAPSVVGSWGIDRVGFGRAIDEARAKLERDMPAKLAAVPAADRAGAKTFADTAVMLIESLRGVEMDFDVSEGGHFKMTGIDAVGQERQSASGTWTDRAGSVEFTVTKKNGAAFDGTASRMSFVWQDANTLVMGVPNLSVGIPLKRR